MVASKEDLFAEHIETEDFELPSGLVVRLRGLTAYEVHLMRKQAGGDGASADALALSMGLVEPKLTEDEALRWMKSRPAGESVDACARIRDLSGLNDAAPKEAYKSLRGRPDE